MVMNRFIGCLSALLLLVSIVQSQVLPDSSQLRAWEDFNGQYNRQWTIRWHEETGTPATIYGFKTTPFTSLATPDGIARNFLSQYRTIFKMKESLADLSVLRLIEDNGVYHVDFQQTYEDIPILGAEYSVAVGSDKAIQMVGGKYFPEVQAPTVATISEEEAVNRAISFLNIEKSIVQRSSIRLIIESMPRRFILAYQIGINQWEVIVNAITAEIERHAIRFPFASGTGNVYPKDPVNSALTAVTLPRLIGSGEKLDGTYVTCANYELGEAIEPSSNFLYTPPHYTAHDDTHFDDVNVYYHIDKFVTGYWEPLIGSSIPYKVLASVHDPSVLGHDNASADWDGLTLWFGHGGSRFYDLAKKDDIIYHEYTHIVTGRLGLSYSYAESGAMHEGYSDYHAASYTDDASIGEWVTRSFSDLRTLETSPTQFHYNNFNTVSYTGPDPINTESSKHANGMIWSGALWDLRNALGAEIANFLIYKGLVYKHGFDTRFIDGREGIIIADQNYYSGAHVNTIRDVFAARGIAAIPLAPSITMNATGTHPVPNWNTVSGVDSYKIYRGTKQGAPGTINCSHVSEYFNIASTASTTFTDYAIYIDPAEDILVCYYVTSINQDGESEPSNKVGVHGMAPLKITALPAEFRLYGNYPNPFNPSTTIRFDLPEMAIVSLRVYDIKGRQVARLVDAELDAGYHSIVWDGTDELGVPVASGVYICRLSAVPAASGIPA